MKDLSQMTDEELDQAIMQKASAQIQEMDYSSLSDDELDNLILEKSISSTPQDRSGEAFVRSFGNATSFGYLPQIQAVTEPLIQGAMDFFAGDDTDKKLREQGFVIDEGPQDSYVQRRDRNINELQQLSEENPMASAAGEITGTLASSIPVGGGLNKVLKVVGKAPTIGKRFFDAAKSGAAVGAIRNPGDTEGEVDILQIEDRAKNAAKDAATGLVVQGGLEGVRKGGQAIKSAGRNLKRFSENKTLKSAGFQLKDFRKAFGKKKTAELGQTAIDEKLVSMGDDVEKIAKKSETALKKSGAKIGEIYSKADELTTITRGDIQNFNNEFLEEASKRLQGKVGGKEVAQKLENVLEVVRENPSPTFGELRKLRSSIDDQINFAKTSNDLPEYQSELMHLRNKVQDLVKKKIGDVSPRLSNELTKENKRFSNISEISKISRDKMAREETNAAFGLRERISGGAGGTIGAMIGGVPGAVAGAALGSISTKVARQYGTPFVAITANKVARALEKNQNAIGKFSETLIEAANNPEKFVATINMLMKDPEFKRNISGLNGQYRRPAKGKR